MNELMEVQKKVIPQAIEMMEKRHAILKQISMSEPIGRRMLSTLLNLSERTTRTEIDFLKKQKLINISVSGMYITEDGKSILKKLDYIMDEVMGISELEDKLKSLLDINEVVISKNVNNTNDIILKNLSKKASEYLLKKLNKDDVVAISGGTTMRSLASNIESDDSFKDVTVVPTRGSIGADIEIQANSVAALLAKKLDAKVKFLYVPDQLEEEAREALLKIPDVKKTLDCLNVSDKMVFSFGKADVMARRRGMSEKEILNLKDRGAIGEVFGYYFDKNGNIVTKLNTVGIDIDMYKNSKDAIVVFSGDDKIEPFLALYKINKNLTLITDEDSAKKILKSIE